MSSANYNRDRNITGNIQAISFVPEYGSSVSYEYANQYFVGADNSYIANNKNLNNTKITYNLKFSNKTEEEARSMLHLIEETQNSISGNLDFHAATASGVELAFPTGNIYKNKSGSLIAQHQFDFHNNLFDINLSLVNDGEASFFNWSGSSYLNTGNFSMNWADSTSYEKFDVVYFTGLNTGDSQYIYKTINRMNSFYYCSSSHTSSSENSPTGLNSAWTRNFLYEMDDDVNLSFDDKNSLTSINGAFTTFNKKNSHSALIKDLTLNFKNRTNKETSSILHFLEKRENGKPFALTLPQLFDRKKFFVAKNCKHTFVYKDCNDITITLDEVVKLREDSILDTFDNNVN